jgi:CubicO group peptidase (beta-lactamase class C family)
MTRFALLLIALVCGCGGPVIVRDDGPRDEKAPVAAKEKANESENAPNGDGPGDEDLPPVDTTELDPFFLEQMAKAHVPGAAVAVTRGGKLKWAKGYGLANIEQNQPVTTDTLFMLASVSKPFVGVALLQLAEDPQRGFGLDADISTKLPFRVRHPRFPDTPITARMLAAHTSGLLDVNFGDYSRGDSPTSLREWLQAYVKDERNWSSWRPGTSFAYSNNGAALAGLVVESVAGMDLQTYSKKHIFDPLGMTETSWFLRDLDPSRIATPYVGVTNAFRPQAHYGYPEYPSGQLRTSVRQLAGFLNMIALRGELDGKRVLSTASADEMRRPQFPSIEPTQGFFVFYQEAYGKTRLLGHGGADMGVSTEMYFDPETTAGFVLLTNGNVRMTYDAGPNAAMDAMCDKLIELAKTLP